MGDINELPLIKLQEVFTPARPTNIIQTIQRYQVFIISPNKVINMSRYTTEEIQDNYEFKVARRILKKEFPYIKDMRLTNNWNDYRSLFFVVLDINVYELMESLGMPITKASTKYISWVSNSGYPYLSMFFSPKMGDEYNIPDIGKQIQKTINKIQESPSIPHDMKLPRSISISTFKPVGQYDIPTASSPQDSVEQ